MKVFITLLTRLI